jgi:mono/diheme cytochrome c family protein
MEYDLFMNLELASSNELFRSNANMRKYRYLIQSSTPDNEDSLPVGWVSDTYEGEEYVGLTCAACHTTQVNYNGNGIRIDGGPAMADMTTMLKDLEAALEKSQSGPKFEALAKKALGDKSQDPQALEVFREIVKSRHAKIKKYNTMNAPTHKYKGKDIEVDYGYARLDAFGRIYNRVMYHINTTSKERSDTNTPLKFAYNPANAPVSYPFLWDTPQHDFVQWNGVGDNGSALGLGPLGRNTGEVIGVFATFNIDQNKPGHYDYPSSAETRNQQRLENHLKDLWSPSWEELAKREILPSIDEDKAAAGAKVYEKYQCATCHQDIERSDSNRIVIAQFSSLDLIGTDPGMATNAIAACGNNGILRPSGLGMCGAALDNPNQVSVLSALTKVTAGVMAEGVLRKIGVFFAAIIDNPFGVFSKKETYRHVELEINNKDYLNVYKGRPLNGIWATAPYLHNGSVPNLYELFLPSCTVEEQANGKKCRSNQFTVGNRELDHEKVGFVQYDADAFSEPSLFVFDTSLPSNSNKGHEYAVGKTWMPALENNDSDKVKVKRDNNGKIIMRRFEPITEEERMALVEFIKTL